MLPNWLYGKSKSKLAELLGGGGTPSDYNQVKAQVTQNTENISGIYDVMGKTGSKNWLKLTDVITGAEKATITNKGANINVKTIAAVSWGRFAVRINVQPNTNYTISTHINYISGKARVAIRNADDSANIYESRDIQSDVDFSQKFNTGANSQVVVRLFCTANTPESGEVNYENAMIRLATDVDPTYAPYAMTNVELTDDVAIKSSEITVNTTNVNSESISRNYVNKSAGIKVLVLQAKPKADLVVGTTYELGTVPSDYLPSLSTGFIKEDVVNSTGSTALIEISSGKLKLTPRVNNLSAAYSFTISVVYV